MEADSETTTVASPREKKPSTAAATITPLRTLIERSAVEEGEQPVSPPSTGTAPYSLIPSSPSLRPIGSSIEKKRKKEKT
jgi:hypothetical protein